MHNNISLEDFIKNYVKIWNKQTQKEEKIELKDYQIKLIKYLERIKK